MHPCGSAGKNRPAMRENLGSIPRLGQYPEEGKESACDAGDLGSIPGLGRSPGGGHGNPLQYSCLENPHGERSLAKVHMVAKSGQD